MSKEGKVLATGSVYVDIVANGFQAPDLQLGKMAAGREFSTNPGGSALIFGHACSALGLATVIIGKVGDDSLGKVLGEVVRDQPHLTPIFITSPKVSTNVGVHAISEDRREMRINFGTANQTLTVSEVAAAAIDHIPSAAYFYLGGIVRQHELLPQLRAFTAFLRNNGVKVVLDHGRITSEVSQDEIALIRELVQEVDYYLPSKEEFLRLWEADSIEEAARKVQAVSNTVLVIKDETDGAIGIIGKKMVRIPAIPVQAIHSVGAGDTFDAGFVKAHTMGFSLESSILFANATAAFYISQLRHPTKEEVFDLLADTSSLQIPQENAFEPMI